MIQRKRLNSTLLLLCKVERGDGTFPWELWERAAEAAASDGASPAVGTLIATPGSRSQGWRQIHKRRTHTGVVHSSIHPPPSRLAQGSTHGQCSVDSC